MFNKILKKSVDPRFIAQPFGLLGYAKILWLTNQVSTKLFARQFLLHCSNYAHPCASTPFKPTACTLNSRPTDFLRIIRFLSWLVFVIAFSACAVAPENLERSSNKKNGNEAIASGEDESNSEMPYTAKRVTGDPGLIHIERRTREYSISMVLDASDENVYFVMDLPKDQQQALQQPEPETKGDTQPPQEVVEETPEPAVEAEPPVEVEQPIEQIAEEQAVAEPPSQPLLPERDEARASKYVLYAQTYFFEKKYARALEEINRALEYSPQSAVAHSLKGSINYKMGDMTKARSSWEEALKLDASLDNVQHMLNELNKVSKPEQQKNTEQL